MKTIKNKKIVVRCSDKERKIISKKAVALGLIDSQYVRHQSIDRDDNDKITRNNYESR